MSTGAAPPLNALWTGVFVLELCQPDSFFSEAWLHGTTITAQLHWAFICLDVSSW
jgi:hypothetical protein